MIESARLTEPRAPTTIDNAEMRALLSAVRSGYEDVRTDGRLAARRHAAQAAFGAAWAYLDDLELRVRAGTVGRAAEEADVAGARAAASRRRPRWLRMVRWPVVLSIGAFDTWYFAQTFQYLTSSTGDKDTGRGGFVRLWESYAAYAPGIVLAAALATSGVLLLLPLRAWQAAAHRFSPRSPERGGSAETTADGPPGDEPGPGHSRGRIVRLTFYLLPLAFVLTLLCVVADWAGLRAASSAPPEQGYPKASVALLLVMLSVSAIAVKIAADDPDGEHAGAAGRRLAIARGRYLRRSRRAGALIGRYESSWSDLRTLRDELLGLLRLKAVSAWEAFILRTRALHQRAGNIAAIPAGAPLYPAETDDRLILPEFENVLQPRPELGPLHEICRLIDGFPPSVLRTRKEEIDKEYLRQLNKNPVDIPERA
ncbi:hypothetical protein [Frankia sp. CiP3]|uniref:hypothetical protein n=1 Tax=Frankia sp. CiP3 TaxID=2880971 RepID=UPI001EF64830|nr:hypothetical protein [Frankia sp. CiP3]